MSVCLGTLSCLSSFNFVLSYCHDIENVRRHTPGSGDVALRRHWSDARRVDQQRGSVRGGSQKGLSEEKLQGKGTKLEFKEPHYSPSSCGRFLSTSKGRNSP
ncbi:uncharacterized protein [Palaemon carinicauda]|uniref:uncharacterized protein n=1 Tax=Palaemon carinicauda TaxID=392227 RepID=UPI0035B6809A